MPFERTRVAFPLLPLASSPISKDRLPGALPCYPGGTTGASDSGRGPGYGYPERTPAAAIWFQQHLDPSLIFVKVAVYPARRILSILASVKY